MMKPSRIKLSKDDEALVLERLADYLSQEFDLDIGNLPAKMLLDFLIETLAPVIANQLIDDMEPWLYERMTGILEDMHSFKQD